MTRAVLRRLLTALLISLFAVGATMLSAGPSMEATAATIGPDLCAQVAYNAGFRDQALVTAVAVALAESSCNPAAANPSGATGLWQVLASAHPQYPMSCLLDAQCNATAAWAISGHGTNWAPWTVYTTGSYLTRVSTAQAAVGRLAQAPLGSVLNSGQAIVPTDQLTSTGGQYVFVTQADGNAVLYRSGVGALFSTGTYGHPGAYLVLQGDGNLVVYSATDRALWANYAFPGPGAFLALQPDGNLVEYSAAGEPVWATNTAGAPGPPPSPPPAAPAPIVAPAGPGPTRDTLPPGGVMTAGMTMTSIDGRYTLAMQADGNLVVYGPRGPVFWTGSQPATGAFLVMQGDGNAVVYDTAGARWDSATWAWPGARLVIQPDGNLVVYSSTYQPLWASGPDSTA